MRNKKFVVVGIVVGVICFILGNVTGFFIGVSSSRLGQEFLEGAFSRAQPADTSRSKKISRKGFSLSYPANWKVDTSDEDYDPDHLFSIDSPNDNTVTFFVFDMPSTPRENVQEQVDAFATLIKNPVKTTFAKWGQCKGYGVDLKGKMLSFLKGGARIFSHSSKSKSFIVIETYYEEDMNTDGPGFRLIESTFKMAE